MTIQTRIHEKRLNEKILVPFGAHPDQVLNLLQVAARDVIGHYFDRPDAYVEDRRRRRSSNTETEVLAAPLFTFVHRYRHALRVCFLLNATAMRELAREYEQDSDAAR